MKRDEETRSLFGAIRGTASRVLRHRGWPVVLAFLAVILVLPSLRVGWVMDDHFLRLAAVGSPRGSEVIGSPTDMFRLLDGNPERTERLMDLGIVPWWTFKEIKAAFWRPLSVLTHWLDFRLWPQSPALMHAQSVLWYGALVAAVAFAYRRFLGHTWLAGAAALLYAIDDAHGLPVGFLANRNAILATLFGVLTILAHDRWRRDAWRAGSVLGPLCLIASLLSAEAGIATCAYLAAHALFLDRGAWRTRLIAVAPYVVLVFVWRIVWSHLGYGVSGMDLYIDPGVEPLRFAQAAANRAPILLLGQWGFPPSGIAMALGSAGMNRLWLAASVFLTLLFAVLFPLLRREPVARFWALGMVLSVIPICATFPMDRLLFFVGFGASGLLAQFLVVAFSRPSWRPTNIAWRATAVALGSVFVFFHFIIAPLALPARAAFPAGPKAWSEQLLVQLPTDKTVEDQDVVIVNAPSAIHMAWSAARAMLSGHPVPRHMRGLAPGLPSVEVFRVDAQTLTVRPRDGYLAWKFDRLARNDRCPMHVGQRVELTGMTVEVTALTDDGRPAEAAFRFAVPLEHPSLRWLQWKDGVLATFVPPAIGETVQLTPSPPSFSR